MFRVIVGRVASHHCGAVRCTWDSLTEIENIESIRPQGSVSSDILPHSLVFPLILPQLLAAIYAILPCTHSDLYVQSVSLPDRPLEVEALEVKMIRTCVVGRLVLFVSRGVHRFSRG